MKLPYITAPQNKRSKLLAKNVAASFILKGWSAIVVLSMVPLTLKMLGIYQNGVWLTISSILIWVDLLDIGLSNGLRNMVAQFVAQGEKEKVKETVASAFFMLTIIMIPAILISAVLIWSLNIYNILGVDVEKVHSLELIIFTAFVLTASSFVLKATGTFFMGLQLPAFNHLFVAIGQTLSLILTFTAYIAGIRSLFVVVLINTAAPLITWMITVPYTFHVKYPEYRPTLKHISLKMSRSLCSVGFQFFTIQICGVILFLSSNIIISKLLSPAEVTPYQVAYRYFNIAFIVFSTICMPFWNATTDAYTRGDKQWIHKSSRLLDCITLGLLVVILLMLILSKFVYSIWIGNNVEMPWELSVSVACYVSVLTISQRYSFILNGLNILKIQIIFTVFAAVIFLPLAYYVCETYKTVTSLAWVMCLVNTPGLIANAWKYHKVVINR